MEFDEEFKICPFNDSLEVSQYGRVIKAREDKSKDKMIILEQSVYKRHLIVENPRDKERFERVHRLVALTWLKDQYEKGLVVHHIDFNPLNNRVDNLCWLTGEEHAEQHGVQVMYDDEI
jgi:hypothetical protein